MRKVLVALLPAQADNTIRGMKLPVYVFALIAVVSLVRSCIHLLAPDGGAGSIAGMNLSVAGAEGIIFAFALWGSAQLIYAVIQLVVAFRYRSLVPFMYVLLIVETLLRQLVGHMKPVTFAHTPPGAIGNYVALPVASLMLILSLWKPRQSNLTSYAPVASHSATILCMFRGLEHTAIASPDPAKLAKWYVEKLDFRINHTYDGNYFVRSADGSMLEIIPSEGARAPQKMKDPGIRHLAISVDQFDEAMGELKKRGVQFLGEPINNQGNRLQFFSDGDGNILHLIRREKPLP